MTVRVLWYGWWVCIMRLHGEMTRTLDSTEWMARENRTEHAWHRIIYP